MKIPAFAALFLLAVAAAQQPARAAGLLLNHDFNGSLASWTTSGTVFNTGNAAVFSDSVAGPASIFQSVIVPEDFEGFDLTFDFFNGLSSTVVPGNVPDALFATLYLGSDPFGTSLAAGTFDEAIALFDMDHSGAFNLAAGATLTASPKGPGWLRYNLARVTAPAFAYPGNLTVAFEFYDLNGSGSDSAAAVDNVLLLLAVPEPGRAMLCAIALACFFGRRRR